MRSIVAMCATIPRKARSRRRSLSATSSLGRRSALLQFASSQFSSRKNASHSSSRTGSIESFARDIAENRTQAPHDLYDSPVVLGGELIGAAETAQNASDAPPGKGRRQGRRRIAFALVGFVEDRVLVRRDQPTAQREIEEEQRVVDDDDVCVARRIATAEEKTIADVRTQLTDAVVRIGVELFPLQGVRDERELRSVAGRRPPRPSP